MFAFVLLLILAASAAVRVAFGAPAARLRALGVSAPDAASAESGEAALCDPDGRPCAMRVGAPLALGEGSRIDRRKAGRGLSAASIEERSRLGLRGRAALFNGKSCALAPSPPQRLNPSP